MLREAKRSEGVNFYKFRFPRGNPKNKTLIEISSQSRMITEGPLTIPSRITTNYVYEERSLDDSSRTIKKTSTNDKLYRFRSSVECCSIYMHSSPIRTPNTLNVCIIPRPFLCKTSIKVEIIKFSFMFQGTAFPSGNFAFRTTTLPFSICSAS